MSAPSSPSAESGLFPIAHAVIRAPDLDALLASVTEAVQGQLGLVRCSIYLVDVNSLRLKLQASSPEPGISGLSALPDDLPLDPSQSGPLQTPPDNNGKTSQPGRLQVPISDPEGTLGLLVCERTPAQEFSDEERELAEQAASLIAERLADLHADQQASEALRVLEKREQKFRSLVENAFDCIVVYDRNARILYGTPSVTRLLGYTIEDAVGKIGLDFIAEEDRPDTVAIWTSVLQNPGVPFRLQLRLLRKGGGFIWTEIMLTNCLDDPTVNGIVANFRDISHRKATERSIYRLANFDRLTELPNRSFLISQLKHSMVDCERGEKSLSILKIGINQFPDLVTTYGRAVSELILREVVFRFQEQLDEMHFLARAGEYEFVVLLPTSKAYEASRLAYRLLRAFRNRLSIGHHNIRVRISIGIARCPQDGTSVEVLLGNAQLARVHAKPGGYAFFRAEEGDRLLKRLAIAKDFSLDLEQGNLAVRFQPRVFLEDDTVAGFEALLDWQNSEHRDVSNQELIQVVEDSGQIRALGQWVFAEVCRQMQWLAGQGVHIKAAVNLSAMELVDSDLGQWIGRTMATFNVPAENLELEITESAAMTNIERSLKSLRDLKALGLHLAIDDFGTGYSSLNYLKRLPIDSIKIDKSFIDDLDSEGEAAAEGERMIRSIVSLARGFKLNVVAEGVETGSQYRAVKEAGCDEAQGFWIAAALPAVEIPAWLQNRNKTGAVSAKGRD